MTFGRANKYKAQRTNGFASKLESAVHDILKLKELAGEIRDIKCQQSVVLQEGPPKVRINWKVDFSYWHIKNAETVYCEAKGIRTADYVLKLKLWRKQKPFTLEIYMGHYSRPCLAERIETNPQPEVTLTAK